MTVLPASILAFFERPTTKKIIVSGWSVAALLLTLFPMIRFLHSGNSMDYRIWFEAGSALWDQREIYILRGGAFPFMYPPACAFLLAWPALFGKAAFILLLAAINTGAWIFSIWAIRKLTGATIFVLLVANLLVAVYVWSSYHLGQPNIVLFALMAETFVALRARREVLAGVLLALAVGIKAFPILAVPYLIWRRRWLATVSLFLALLALLFLLPLPFRGPAHTLSDFQRWRAGMLHYEAGGIAQRALRGYSWKNQSIFGLANRMLRPVSAEESSTPLYANVAALDFRVVNGIIAAIALLVGLSFLLVMPGTPTTESLSLENAALLMLILLFTPLAFGYLFFWLIFPFALLGQRFIDRPSPILGVGLGLAMILMLITAFFPRTAQIYGSVFFAALALYFTAAAELAKQKAKSVPGAAVWP